MESNSKCEIHTTRTITPTTMATKRRRKDHYISHEAPKWCLRILALSIKYGRLVSPQKIRPPRSAASFSFESSESWIADEECDEDNEKEYDDEDVEKECDEEEDEKDCDEEEDGEASELGSEADGE